MYRPCLVPVSSECLFLLYVLHHFSDMAPRRLARLEGQYLVCICDPRFAAPLLIQLLWRSKVMQSQMIGMQSSLDRILSAVQPQNSANPSMPPPHPGMYPHMDALRDGTGIPLQHRNGFDPASGPVDRGRFPPLPGFAPPVSIFFPLLSIFWISKYFL